MEIAEKEIVNYNDLLISRNNWEKCNLVEVIKKLSSLSLDTFLKDFVLEVVIRISQILYWRSCRLLKEDVFVEEPNEKDFAEERTIGYSYYKLIPLDNRLFEKRFLPSVYVEFKEELDEVGIEFLVKVMLEVLEREAKKQEVVEVISCNSIEDYMERVKKELEVRKEIKFRSFLKEVGCFCKERVFDIVYYFLAILFLSYLRQCYLVQNSEEEDIKVYSL
ncbi:MAG: hypothetical protein GXO57_00095 [Thermodesulfobacteria bacterium]|nr:hypothetical protein [Thermodesulfobacteriota bacterium]